MENKGGETALNASSEGKGGCRQGGVRKKSRGVSVTTHQGEKDSATTTPYY